MSRLMLALAGSLTALAVPTTITVLPLGDSITFGCGSDAAPPDWFACCNAASGGYRAPLWAALNASASVAAGAVAVQMVGSESSGHPGWTIAQIAGLRPVWERLAPDAVLLKAGTNDVGQGHSNASMAADLDALLASLRASLPAARLLVATILALPDSRSPGFADTIRYYNAVTVPQAAARHNATVVDLAGATGMCFGPDSPLVNLCAVCNGPCGGYKPQSCPPNGYSYCHPTAAGYSLMAGVWANALLPVLRDIAQARMAA